MPSSQLQTSFTRELKKAYHAFGDSITRSTTIGNFLSDSYPEKVALFLRRLGANVLARNFGNAGFTSLQELHAVPQALSVPLVIARSGVTYEVPSLATVMIGVNDPGNGISQAQTQSNIEQIIRSIRNGICGIVAGQANLPALRTGAGNTEVLQNAHGWRPFIPNITRFLVISDTSASGGFNVGSPLTPPTITGAVTGPTIWVYRQAQAGEAGWSRVADNTDATIGCQKILIISAQWLNYANAGGDTLGADYAPYTTVRAAQLAAANAQAVPFFDLHAYQRALIVAGVVGDSTGAWSNLTNNQHPNALANETYATGLVAALGGDNTHVTSTAQMPTGAGSWANALIS